MSLDISKNDGFFKTDIGYWIMIFSLPVSESDAYEIPEFCFTNPFEWISIVSDNFRWPYFYINFKWFLFYELKFKTTYFVKVGEGMPWLSDLLALLQRLALAMCSNIFPGEITKIIRRKTNDIFLSRLFANMKS